MGDDAGKFEALGDDPCIYEEWQRKAGTRRKLVMQRVRGSLFAMIDSQVPCQVQVMG